MTLTAPNLEPGPDHDVTGVLGPTSCPPCPAG